MKPISSNSKQAIINRNNTFSNSTIVVLQVIVYFKIKKEQLHVSIAFYNRMCQKGAVIYLRQMGELLVPTK
jgi:hypothetical protein